MTILQREVSAVPFPQDATSPQGSYAELKRLVKERGLLDKSIPGYMVRVATIQLLFVASLATLVLVHIFWLQCLNAVFLAFITTQMGFIGHDAGHRQIFASTKKNDILGLLQGNLLIGMSFSWWLDKHNAHHSKPNEVDSDPDISVPMIAFTTEDAQSKRGLFRFMTRHQAWFFFPLLTMVELDLQINSVMFLFKEKVNYPKTEAALLVLHYLWYFGLIFAVLPWWQALIFIAIHKTATGLYLGSVFAPNHKGMLVTERDSPIDFLHRQVLTARNVRANPFTDFWYGGLNYQIEHHLFPSMPRRHLGEAQRVIRAFCQENGISYHETSVPRSYYEIVTFLGQIGGSLRKQAA